ncbi:MAG: porin [Bauldia sp.]|nr:porin [Bauldia sp.]MCW5718001.1 porin [Bauldia sp.]
MMGLLRRRMLALLLALGGVLGATAPAAADSSLPPVEYLKVCDVYGAGFYYIPGTEICTNPVNGDTRWQAEDDQTIRTWSPLVLQLMEQTEAANRAIEAAAVAIAIPTPIILSGDRFALAGNWAQLAGYHAFGLASAFSFGNALSINAGVGVGLQTFALGTRFGLNLNW